jgi:WD40 repeat protein
MHHRYSLFICSIVASVLLLTPLFARGRPSSAWKVYKLHKGVEACTFAPDGSHVALVYLTHPPGLRKSADELWTFGVHLALWDFKTGKVVEKRQWKYSEKSPQDPWSFSPIYIRFAADGQRLVYLDAQAIRIFSVPGYRLEAQIPFKWPAGRNPDGVIPWSLEGFSVTPDGSRAAVAITSAVGATGGFVRVYSLPSGSVIRQWNLGSDAGAMSIYGAALSADGSRVAVSWTLLNPSSDPERFIPSDVNNVRVMDVKTGGVIAGVSTNYYAGPVLFGPNDTLLTGSINPDRRGYKYDSVKVWDIRTGKLLREITNPDVGVHYRLSLSPDGKLLIGYIGTEKARENFVDINSERFEIWDFATGKVVAQSPKIPPLFKTAPHFGDFPPSLQLSPNGRYVLLSWGGHADPVVYVVPQD